MTIHHKPYYSKKIAAFSGWGFDHRIFHTLPLDNTEIVQNITTKTIPDAILGFSMGAYRAIEAALDLNLEHLPLILIGAAPSYNKKVLTLFRNHLITEKETFMRTFYTNCFKGNSEFDPTETTHINDIFPTFNLPFLLEELDHLSQFSLNLSQLTRFKKLYFIHGKSDKIASYKVLKNFLEPAGIPLFTCEGGHFPNPTTVSSYITSILKIAT
jgi:surfactin synthase thioesterase subunit